jgi:hypothetical protein
MTEKREIHISGTYLTPVREKLGHQETDATA